MRERQTGVFAPLAGRARLIVHKIRRQPDSPLPSAPAGEAPARRGGRPALKAVFWAVGVIAALTLLFHAAGGWYFASRLNDRAISAESRREALIPDYTVRVLAVEQDAVTLKKSGEDRLARNGTFGLDWEGGWGILGDVLRQQADGSVVREFDQRSGSPLQPGTLARIDTRVYPGDPLTGLGIPFEDVAYEGELGQYPAWFVPGEGPVWFIFVHGNGMTRLDGLRILSTAVDAGMPTLLPTYRGDEGAPADPGGHLTYGKHEWRDVEAAVRYALQHGAQSVVLEGVSMGGGIVVAFLLESPLAGAVSGVILDSPMLDFERSVEYRARDESLPLVGLPLPRTLVDTAEWMASLRFGVDWGYTDYLDRLGRLNTAILLIHGDADDTVPVSVSDDLSRLRPDLVRDYYVADNAGHVEAWNADPAEYERRVLAFLHQLSVVNGG